jgi:hypothetical protein
VGSLIGTGVSSISYSGGAGNHITDFVSGLDRVQLVGAASNYVIRNVGGSLSRGAATQDVGIFKARPNLFAPDELIAIMQDVGGGTLNLNNRAQFVYL